MNAPAPSPASTLSSSRTARLRTLLKVRRSDGPSLFASASRETLDEARALGPDAAGEVVAAVLQAYAPGGDSGTTERAADLAYELRLAAAVPALVGCIERLSEYDSVAHASLRALERMKLEATEPLLAAYHRCTDLHARVCHGATLVQAAGPDDRVRAALLGLLAEDPVQGAEFLGQYGDPLALPDLSAALDRLEDPEPGKGELRRHEEIVAVAQAMKTLEGTLSAPQQAKFDRAWARSNELWADGGEEVDEYVGAA